MRPNFGKKKSPFRIEHLEQLPTRKQIESGQLIGEGASGKVYSGRVIFKDGQKRVRKKCAFKVYNSGSEPKLNTQEFRRMLQRLYSFGVRMPKADSFVADRIIVAMEPFVREQKSKFSLGEEFELTHIPKNFSFDRFSNVARQVSFELSKIFKAGYITFPTDTFAIAKTKKGKEVFAIDFDLLESRNSFDSTIVGKYYVWELFRRNLVPGIIPRKLLTCFFENKQDSLSFKEFLLKNRNEHFRSLINIVLKLPSPIGFYHTFIDKTK